MVTVERKAELLSKPCCRIEPSDGDFAQKAIPVQSVSPRNTLCLSIYILLLQLLLNAYSAQLEILLLISEIV